MNVENPGPQIPPLTKALGGGIAAEMKGDLFRQLHAWEAYARCSEQLALRKLDEWKDNLKDPVTRPWMPSRAYWEQEHMALKDAYETWASVRGDMQRLIEKHQEPTAAMANTTPSGSAPGATDSTPKEMQLNTNTIKKNANAHQSLYPQTLLSRISVVRPGTSDRKPDTSKNRKSIEMDDCIVAKP